MSLILEALRKSEAERRRGETPSVYNELPPTSRSSPARRLSVSGWLLAAGCALLALWGVAMMFHRVSSQPALAVHVARPRPAARQPSAPSLPPVPHFTPPPIVIASAAEKTPTPHEPSGASPPAAQQAIQSPVPAPPPAAAAPRDDTLRLSDLNADERKALPPLKLSMHMWNDDPSQRFVILDGNRLREGDRIGDAVVTAITADGVVLDWNGRKLKVPIR